MRTKLHLLLLALTCASVPALRAELPSTPEDGWVANNSVSAIVRTADTTYLGGSFTALGLNRPYGVPVDATNGAPVAVYPKVNGSVRCVAADGAGGWYIGGEFSQVGSPALPEPAAGLVWLRFGSPLVACVRLSSRVRAGSTVAAQPETASPPGQNYQTNPNPAPGGSTLVKASQTWSNQTRSAFPCAVNV